MSDLKIMTYEDLYFFCKNKNPDKKIVVYEDLGIDINKKRFRTPRYIYLEQGKIILGKMLKILKH